MSAGIVSREKQLRCFCARKPLLATYGIRKGNLYVHVKVYKQSRIFGEIFIEGGKVMLKCRECLRIHTVNIVQNNVTLSEASDIEMSNFGVQSGCSLPLDPPTM